MLHRLEAIRNFSFERPLRPSPPLPIIDTEKMIIYLSKGGEINE